MTAFQTFTAKTRPEDGPPRLAALRAAMRAAGVDGFLVPRADRFQGEYVAPCDERLAWLTGFTGSAGFAAVLQDIAGVFVDGRYRLQLRAQSDMDSFTPVDWPETQLADWLIGHAGAGARIGFDPWLHTISEIEKLTTRLEGSGITLTPVANLVDHVWTDRPAPPMEPAFSWPERFAGQGSAEKLALVAGDLARAGHGAAVITQPDSLCWMLNLRGADIAHTPLVQAMGVLHGDGRLDLYCAPEKLRDVALPDGVTVHAPDAFETAIGRLTGRIRVDPASAPQAVGQAIADGAGNAVTGRDPCLLPKATKTPAEIAATTEAHLRDGAAVARFLHWFDTNAPGGNLTEIDCVRAMEGFRTETGTLKDISFDTIAGTGPNGAVIHYRVTEETNAPLLPGQLIVLDSGGQYEDGTTDITRTLPVGAVGEEEKTAFTQVLQGMIAIHRVRFPKGVAGAHLDALARAPLWMAGRDFDHGTGHGVGVYLGVHEGPQRLSRVSDVPLQPGMILSNEPGYYRAGAFGIRIENLVVVAEAPALSGGDDRDMYRFDTLTHAPINRDLIRPTALTAGERDWINTYHAAVLEKIGPRVNGDVRDWLAKACAPI